MPKSKISLSRRRRRGNRSKVYRDLRQKCESKYSSEQLSGDKENILENVTSKANRITFCKRKELKEKNFVQDISKSGFFYEIQKIIDPMIQKADRLVYNQTTNNAGRLYALAAKCTGGKKVDFTKRLSYTTRMYAAALSHTSGPSWHLSSWAKLMSGRQPGHVLFDDTWHISSASCECPRGQVRCHHMATLLLFGYYNYSSTDISCKWSAPKGSQGHDVKTMNDLYPLSKAYQATTCVLSDSVVEEFKNKLSVFEGAIRFGWLLSDYDNSNEIIINIEDIIFSAEFMKHNIKYFKDKVSVNQEKIKLIAEETKGQVSNYRWLMWRKNRLTASQFGIILKACARNKFPPSLFKTL
ncbi:hypothetical protein RN001_004970, partial [Aquatica leii]